MHKSIASYTYLARYIGWACSYMQTIKFSVYMEQLLHVFSYTAIASYV